MRNVREIYPDYNEKDSWFCISSYNPMVEEIGNILVQVDDHDYQGDSRYILHDGTRYGFLVVGWGSCSGCDALQGCSNFDDVQKLFEHIIDNVLWFDCLDDLQKYFKEKNWKDDFCGHQDETKEFVKLVLKL